MPLDVDQLTQVTTRAAKAHQAEKERLDLIHAAVRGQLDDIYVPRSATDEYRALVAMSRYNVMPLVVGSLAQALYMDGFRPRRSEQNSPVWDQVWQPNRMDARQAGLYRAAIQYGCSYASVLPDRRRDAPSPVAITPHSPRQVTALYEDPVNDEWPRYVMVWGRKAEQGREAWLYDAEQAYGLLVGEGGAMPVVRVDEQGEPLVRRHDLRVTPFVRYLDGYDDLDDGPRGKVEPLIPAQRQLNQTTFNLLMAQQFAAFRQRWATGLAIPETPEGQPFEPFNAAVNRVWSSDNEATRFGDFEATDLRPYLEARDKMALYIANAAQIPPHNMVVGPGISNISAEALAALEAGHRQDVAEHQSTFGEANEQLLRLAGLAMGERSIWKDRSSEAIWRDTTPRSLSELFAAWGIGVQQVGVPEEGAWEHLPVSDQERQRWRRLRAAQSARATISDLDRIVNGGPPGAESGREPADAGAPR